MDREIVSALQPVLEAFKDLDIVYYIGGSMASSAHGIARSSFDVDLLADMRPEHVGPLVERLQASCYVDEGAASEAMKHRSSFNVIHLATMMKIDVFLPKDRDFDRIALSRRICEYEQNDIGMPIFFCSAEDSILSKIEWYKKGDQVSERQWSDILGILEVQKDKLDRDYLIHWAAQLGVMELLQRAFAQSEQPPIR